MDSDQMREIVFCSVCGKGLADHAIPPLPPMSLDVYQALAMRTSKPLDATDQLLHAVMGLTSESGELMTPIKAYRFYNKELDNENVIEELGDILWFVQLAATSRGVTLEEVARRNIAKLAKRYPEKYSDELAIVRADKRPVDSRLGEE